MPLIRSMCRKGGPAPLAAAPTRIFEAATFAAAVAKRDAELSADDVAAYDANPHSIVVLRNSTSSRERWLVRRGGAWLIIGATDYDD